MIRLLQCELTNAKDAIERRPNLTPLVDRNCVWWAKELRERQFFHNLTDKHTSAMLHCIMTFWSNDPIVVELQKKVEQEIIDVLQGE